MRRPVVADSRPARATRIRMKATPCGVDESTGSDTDARFVPRSSASPQNRSKSNGRRTSRSILNTTTMSMAPADTSSKRRSNSGRRTPTR